MAELNVARDSASCCIFNNKFIYVFSGRIKFSPIEITDFCEFYDIEKNVEGADWGNSEGSNT